VKQRLGELGRGVVCGVGVALRCGRQKIPPHAEDPLDLLEGRETLQLPELPPARELVARGIVDVPPSVPVEGERAGGADESAREHVVGGRGLGAFGSSLAQRAQHPVRDPRKELAMCAGRNRVLLGEQGLVHERREELASLRRLDRPRPNELRHDLRSALEEPDVELAAG
jgi:hypothetical protein